MNIQLRQFLAYAALHGNTVNSLFVGPDVVLSNEDLLELKTRGIMVNRQLSVSVGYTATVCRDEHKALLQNSHKLVKGVGPRNRWGQPK